ncbi:hypothetical protein [Myroides pelagicus]|uniref:Tetratricopeptide repeat protein n=1 Tax=Myroides pelagicus TaxID=270914 RepID=A0A7K1GI94_9FLAO|nr:hypothetical protein [Myroides pelagicus]MTH28586.1 hypothetical protein [Myroides pelagicus]
MATNYGLEIQKLLLQVGSSKDARKNIKLLKQGVNLADASQDLDWGIDLRMRLINMESEIFECKESFPAFSWMLEKYNSNPDYFDDEDFLWFYNAMFSSCTTSVSISKEKMIEIVEDYKVKLVVAGYSLRSYYHLLALFYIRTKNFEKSLEVIDLAEATIIDALSGGSNQTWEKEMRVGNLLALDSLEEALVVIQPLFLVRDEYNLTASCAYIEIAFHYAKLREDEIAKEYLSTGLSLFDLGALYNTNYVVTTKAMLMYLLNRYDMEGTYSLFEELSRWGEEIEDFLFFFFAKFAAVIFKGGGKARLDLQSHLSIYQDTGEYDLHVLHEFYKTKAFELADQFDLRNGNTWQRDELERLLMN